MKVDCCLSPDLLHHFEIEDKAVVVIDVFRASSTICSALYNGAKRVSTAATIEGALKLRAENSLVAGERNGEKLPGFDWGNSPRQFLNNKLIQGRELVLTTTNGSKCIEMARPAKEVLSACFLNARATANYLINQQQDVLLFCAAWKGKPCLEDTLLAGYLTKMVGKNPLHLGDAALVTRSLWMDSCENIFDFLKKSSHYRRLAAKGLEADIKFCCSLDIYNQVNLLKEGGFIAV